VSFANEKKRKKESRKSHLVALQKRQILLPNLPDVRLDPLPERSKQNLIRRRLKVAEILVDLGLVHRSCDGRSWDGRTRRNERARSGGETEVDVGGDGGERNEGEW